MHAHPRNLWDKLSGSLWSAGETLWPAGISTYLLQTAYIGAEWATKTLHNLKTTKLCSTADSSTGDFHMNAPAAALSAGNYFSTS
jgi:hypothetical protein